MRLNVRTLAMSTQVDARAIALWLKPEPGEPLHRQLESALRRLIHLGEVPPGASLPGELELAAELGMSRHTVRHSLGVLAAEGLLRRQRGAVVGRACWTRPRSISGSSAA